MDNELGDTNSLGDGTPPAGSQASPWGFSQTSDSTSAASTKESLPQIDGYRITSKLGEGGMGTVWRAEQLSTHRIVALKLLNGSTIASDRTRRRFEREIELASRLQHPNITRVFEAGQYRGVYFYAMELVDGVPLDQFVRSQNLDLPQIVDLMQRVCASVEHAHQRGVIHRDLKPSNILVSPDGQPHVLDFGLAKALHDEEEAGLTITREGATAGTPAYMSPEQASGNHFKIDTRTDVYALGVILYRLITNDHPHELTGSRYDVLKRIIETDVRRPRLVRLDLDRDLEAILMKALSREPKDRYSNAGELANDLARYQRGDAVFARAMTLQYLLWKQAIKHRKAIALSCVVLAALLGLTIFAFIRITQARDESQRRLAASLLSEGDALATSNQWQKVKEKYEASRTLMQELGEPTTEQDIALWSAYRQSPPPLMTINLGEKPSGIAPLMDGRRAVIILGKRLQEYDLATGLALRSFNDHEAAITSVAVSTNGRWMASGDESGKVVVWKLDDASVLHAFKDHPTKVSALAFTNKDDTYISGSSDGLLHHRQIQSGESLGTMQIRPEPNETIDVRHIEPYSDRDDILVSVRSNRCEIWNLKRKIVVNRLYKGEMYGNRVPMTLLTHDATMMVMADGDRLVIRESGSSERLFYLFGHTRPVTKLVRSFDHEHFASGSEDSTVRVWNLRHKNQPQVYTDHTGTIRGVCFLPGVPVLASVSDDGTCKVWTLNELHALFSLMPIASSVTRFSHDGRLVLIAQDDDKPAELWSVEAGQPVREFKLRSERIRSLALTRDSRTALIGCDKGELMIWDVDTETRVRNLTGHTGDVVVLMFSDDGKLMASVDQHGGLQLWETATWTLRWRAKNPRAIRSATFMPHGIALGGENEQIDIYSLDGKFERTIESHPNPQQNGIVSLAVTPDGTRLFAGGGRPDTTIKVWDIHTYKLLATLEGHLDSIDHIAISPDSQHAISGSEGVILKLWDLNDYRHVRTFEHRGAFLGDAIIHGADQKILCTGLLGGWVSQWDLGAANRIEHPPLDAMETLRQNQQDSASLYRLGHWHLERGVRRWAIALLDEAKAGGQNVSALDLAHASWNFYVDQEGRALKEFDKVQPVDEAQAFYIHLCQSALRKTLAPPSPESASGDSHSELLTE